MTILLIIIGIVAFVAILAVSAVVGIYVLSNRYARKNASEDTSAPPVATNPPAKEGEKAKEADKPAAGTTATTKSQWKSAQLWVTVATRTALIVILCLVLGWIADWTGTRHIRTAEQNRHLDPLYAESLGRYVCDKVVVDSTSKSEKVEVKVKDGEKIIFSPDRRVDYMAWFNDNEEVVEFYTDVPTNSVSTIADSKVRNVAFQLRSAPQGPVKFYYLKYRGETPTNWWQIATSTAR